MTDKNLLTAYRYHRQHNKTATRALELARLDATNGKTRYWSKPFNQRKNENFKGYGTDAMQWIERPSDLGLRFVGYADELANLNHKGWFADTHKDSTIRGVVYQLPAHNGHAIFVSGYDNAINGEAESDGPAAIDFGTIWHGDESDNDYYPSNRLSSDTKRDAVNHANSLAESQAEEEREYSQAWQAGKIWAETQEEIKQERQAALALLADRRAAKLAGLTEYASICAMVTHAVETSRREISELRDKCGELANGDYSSGGLYLGFYASPEMKGAFNDGADELVLS